MKEVGMEIERGRKFRSEKKMRYYLQITLNPKK